MASSPVIDKFLDAIVSAAIPGSDLWSADATLDATVPNWRMHVTGPDAIRSEYARWFADAGEFRDLRRFAIRGGAAPDDRAPDDGGRELVEYTLIWQENGVPHAAHHMHLLTVRDELIVADTVFCGGRWPASLLAEMEAADA